MVSGIGQPVLDYQLAVKNQSQLLSEFEKTPSYASAVAYYKANIGSVTTPQQLLNDPKLLNVALSAFQLEGEQQDTGIIRDLLTQNPTSSSSLAQQLVDPRFTEFANAFASLQTDGGATISNPTSVNAVLAGYTTNEYQKFVSNLDSDPTTRQALFFQQTVEDTVDLSDTANLYTQFQSSPAVAQAVAGYKSGIANITSVTQLLNDPGVLNVALKAFNINPATVSTTTLNTILNESSTAAASDPLLAADPNLANFQKTFSTIASDGGATVQSSSSISTIITDYQTNQFANTVAAGSANPNSSSAITAAFGVNGGSTITTLLNDFTNSSGISQSITDYQQNISGVTSVSQLVNNPDLLSVALGAFNLNTSELSTSVITQLLTNSPNASQSLKQQATSLLENDPSVAAFVQAFGSLGAQGSFNSSDFSNIGNLFQEYQNLSSVQSATTAYTTGIQGITSVSQLLSHTAVLDYALQAFNITPSSVTTSQLTTLLNETPTQQASDTTLTSNPNLASFVQTFQSLSSDGGAQLQSTAGVAGVVNAYQANTFAQVLATNNPTTINADFPGASGVVSTLSSNFLNTSGTQEAIQYYENNIDSVSTVDELTGNSQLLDVALGAFNINPNSVTSTQISTLLTETPAQQATDPLVTDNPNIAAFVQAFGTLNTDDGAALRAQSSVNTITSDYQTNQYQQSIATRTQEVIANPTLAKASPNISSATSVASITQAYEQNQFAANLVDKEQQVQATPSSASLSIVEFLGNATLSAVTLGALGLPSDTAALDVSQQEQILTNAGFDPNSLLDPQKLTQFINQFLANAQINSGASGNSAADVALAALTNSESSNDDGIIPVDLSFLQTKVTNANGSSSSGSANGSLVDLFT